MYCWYLQYWPMRYVAVYTHRCPLKAKVHECIRSVPVCDLYSQCKLSTGSFGVNVCVANLSHLVQPRVAATSFHLKIFIRHRKACCCAGRHVHGRLSVLRLPKLSAKARAHKTPAGQRCRYGRELKLRPDPGLVVRENHALSLMMLLALKTSFGNMKVVRS